jgi:hypothetical protein
MDVIIYLTTYDEYTVNEHGHIKTGDLTIAGNKQSLSRLYRTVADAIAKAPKPEPETPREGTS